MKKSFKILVLAVMALCLAAGSAFASVADIVAAAKKASDDVPAATHATRDNAIVSLAFTFTYAGSADKTTEDKALINVARQILSGDVDGFNKTDTTKSPTSGDILAWCDANTSGGTEAMARNLAGITLEKAAATAYANYLKNTITSADAPATEENEKEASSTIGAFYGVVADNLDDFMGMLPAISEYLAGKLKATPVDMLAFIATHEWPTPFTSSDIKVYMNGTLIKTVTASADVDSADVYVDLGAKVSFDVVLSSDVLSVSEDGVALASKDNYYTLSKDFAASGDKAVVVITFASGDKGTFKFTLNVIASGDSSSSATTETYLLKVSDITLTPANAVSNTAKLISADTDNYSATRDLTNLNSTASGDWGSFADFTVSSDYLGGSFSVTVSTDAKLVNVYVKNGTAWDAVDTEEVSGKVITPNTIGTYKVVLSADLVASSDKTVSGDAYFAFDFTVASVDTPKSTEDVVTDAANASADATGGVGGNPIIASGQKIDTKFLSGTQISASAFASFFSSATTVTMLSETEIVEALDKLGLDESYMGNSTDGYKALAFGLPTGYTLTANEKFFVLLTTNENGTANNYLGIGVVPSALNGSSTMVIVFRLLKNPAHTADYMTFPAGNYYVGATNDTASADTSSSTRAVFVTADGVFNIKSEEATLLQGQTASGTATPVEDSDDDDDDNQETSSHGSSSGCDAGFGALALLAVAGALAARKVRK